MPSEPVRTGLAPETLSRAVLDNLVCLQARFPEIATHHDWYMALAYSVRDRMLARWVSTVQAYAARDVKVACYLSAEFLIGPHLGNNLLNLGIEANAREAMRSLGQDLDELLAHEEEPGLGNGGLGRLAACYMDSLATLEIPAVGYGIRYEFGIFDQEIRDGWQVEAHRQVAALRQPVGDRAAPRSSVQRRLRRPHRALDRRARPLSRALDPERVVKGVPYDTPVRATACSTATSLRLWSARRAEAFDLDAFKVGDYYGAVDEKVRRENLTKVLYPNDEPEPASSCASSSSTSSSPARCRTCIRLLQRAGEPIDALPREVRGPAQRHPSRRSRSPS